MKGHLHGFLAFFIFCGIFFSCEKDETNFSGKSKKPDFSAFGKVVYPVDLTCGGTVTSPLIEGKDAEHPVGNVTVTQTGNNLQVTFNITREGFSFSEVHLSITQSLDQVPGFGGNPQIGLFNFNDWPKHTEGNSVIFDPIPVPDDQDNTLYILAHSAVNKITGWEQQNDIILPSSAQMILGHWAGVPSSYFSVIINNGDILNGTYDGWCLDLDHYIYLNTAYTANVAPVSYPEMYEMVPIEHKENMFRVNWLLNNYSVGASAPDGQSYTIADIQIAIWTLIEDNLNNLSGAGFPPSSYSVTHINEMVDAAMAIQSFSPVCGGYFGVILSPVASSALISPYQTILIKCPVNCTPVYSGETAWAAGYAYSGNSWAMYFPYTFCR